MRIQFVTPVSLPEALALLATYGDDARIIAGGAGLTLLLREKQTAPVVLVSIERVPALDYVLVAADGLHLGPLARLRDIERSPLVAEQYPALARACGEVGSVRIRNQATLGGNLAEADYATDPPAVLLTLNALVTATKASGSRIVPLAEFFRGYRSTALAPDECITDIFVPALPPSSRMTYLKFRSRAEKERPCVGVAAVVTNDQGICTALRVAIGAACEVPRRLAAVEALAQGQPLSDELIDEIAEGYAAGIEPLDDLRGSAWYRTQMIRVHVRRALREVRDGSW